ncbi:MAG TPA: mechanosensitive ion channel family protein [Candidatus Saccharimonadales bacterium]|nr:mechanosensitive ion channel family protein [Candidatus Saccharimonadales bacterium]
MTRLMAALRDWNWHEVLLTALIVAGSWVAGRLLTLVGGRLGRSWTARAHSPMAAAVLERTLRPTAWLVVLVGVYLALHRYRFGALETLDGALFVAAVALLTLLGGRVLGGVMRFYAERADRQRQDEALASQMLPFADRLGRLVILVLGLLVVLDHFHVEIRSLLVTLGVGSLAVGLALQETLANMFGGFAILVDRPFRVGDRVQLATGETGDVLEIGLRSTRLQTPENHVLIVPNSVLVRTSITNLSLPDVQAGLRVEVALAQEADVTRARELMLAAARAPHVLASPEPRVFLRTLEDSLPRLLLVCRVDSFANRLAAGDAVNAAIHSGFRAAGIRMANPAAPVVAAGGPGGLPA